MYTEDCYLSKQKITLQKPTRTWSMQSKSYIICNKHTVWKESRQITTKGTSVLKQCNELGEQSFEHIP